MPDYQASFPVVMYLFYFLSDNKSLLHSYLFRLLSCIGVIDPMRLFISVMLQNMIGIEYQKHYQEFYGEIKSYYGAYFHLYGVDKIHEYVSKIKNAMPAWKIFLFQARMVKENCPRLLSALGEEKVADIDVTTLRSYSSEKEGAESGYNKKNKGKPCFQFSGTFIGKIFVDGKLFPGFPNPKDFFQKAVRRVMALGLGITIVRADSAYMTLGNLLFLTKLSLGYAIGAPATFGVVKDGIKLFKELARKKSSSIISAAKGIAILDLGWVTLPNGVRTRIIIVRRISRKKKKGKWHVKTYYYAVASNLPFSSVKLYKFYHKRQCIEAGFRELKNHYNLERLPFRNLKANEFWITCKIFAMTMFKIFQGKMFPKSFHSLLRKTFLRKICRKGPEFSDGKVEVVQKGKYAWHLRRLLCKTEQMIRTLS